jgi:hypothetical protein
MANSTAPHHKAQKPRVRTPSHDVSQDVSQPVPPRSQPSDISVAKAIATAVRATPGVIDLSPGLLALAATYAANERLVGVVVRHPGPHETAVEVHVTVAMEATTRVKAQGNASSLSAHTETSDIAILTRVANLVREAVYRAMRDLRLPPPLAVDVLIDDIQGPA